MAGAASGGAVPHRYLDFIHVKTCNSGAVRAKAVYLALDINMAWEKEILGLWIVQTERVKPGYRWARSSKSWRR